MLSGKDFSHVQQPHYLMHFREHTSFGGRRGPESLVCTLACFPALCQVHSQMILHLLSTHPAHVQSRHLLLKSSLLVRTDGHEADGLLPRHVAYMLLLALGNQLAPAWSAGVKPSQNPQFSPTCRLFPSSVQVLPIMYRPRVLCLLCADETCSTRWTICAFPGTYCSCAVKRHGKVEVQQGLHACVSSLVARTSSCLCLRSTVQLDFLLSTLLLGIKYNATDRFMRDSICGCYGAERFFLLHYTLHDCRPKFSWNTIVRMYRSWSSALEKRRVATLKCSSSASRWCTLRYSFPDGARKR